ncbi:MAG: hypothetical protein HY287_05800 [Planctomycetes bacterium]|nr:hypothetical protein [Planctomycetota bacterium]
MKYVLSLIIALLLNAAANLMMKVGMKSVAEGGGLLKSGVAAGIATIVRSPVLLTGLICFALNAAFYMYALQSRALKISIAYPIMIGGGFALIAIVARLHPALHERLTTVQLLGILLVLSGIVVIGSQMESPSA